MIASVQLVNPHFFALIYDFKRVGQRFVGRSKRADGYAAGVRVLELARNEQIKRVLATGLPEERITEEMLGFALTWEQAAAWSGHHYSPRSFGSIFPEIIASGVCRRFYVECHRRKVGGHEEVETVCDAAGQPVLYATIEEARAKRREGGDVINYFFFECGIVNDLIRTTYGIRSGDAVQPPQKRVAPTPQPPQICEPSPAKPTCVAQPSQICEPETCKTASLPSQICTGNPRKTASNKNKEKEEESLLKESNSISASRAVALSQFDFSQPVTRAAIKQLSQMVYAPLPARYRSEEDKEAAYARIDAAALALSTMPQVAELGLRGLAAKMAYQADEDSPCQWRAYCRKENPGFAPRLWHLASELVLRKLGQEMDANGWWPAYLPRLTGLVETPPAIDLAELAGIAPCERIGMALETAQGFGAWLAELLTPHGYEVRQRRVGATDERGYAIEIVFSHEDGTQRALRIYHVEDWELVLWAEEQAPLGSLAFVQCLAEALRAGQVA